jgi:hypothetical protein
MDEKLRVAFGEPAHGWLQLECHAGQTAFCETFSHMYPSLSDVCEALCDVLTGNRPPRRVVFLLEPAEVEMVLAPHDGRCRVSLLAFRDRRWDLDGQAVLEFDVATVDVVLAFWRALRRLQTSFPENEFEARWGEPFPGGELHALTRLLHEHQMTRSRIETDEAR